MNQSKSQFQVWWLKYFYFSGFPKGVVGLSKFLFLLVVFDLLCLGIFCSWLSKFQQCLEYLFSNIIIVTCFFNIKFALFWL